MVISCSKGVFCIHQGGWREASSNSMGIQDAIWPSDGRVWCSRQWRMGPQCLLLCQWKSTGLGRPWQHCDRGGSHKKLNVSIKPKYFAMFSHHYNISLHCPHMRTSQLHCVYILIWGPLGVNLLLLIFSSCLKTLIKFSSYQVLRNIEKKLQGT